MTGEKISYLHTGKSDSNQEIREPIHEHSDGHGGGSRALGEELRGDHPRDGAGPDGEEDDEAERRNDREIRHPVYHFLYITEELLSGGSIGALSRLGRTVQTPKHKIKEPTLCLECCMQSFG